MTREPTPTA